MGHDLRRGILHDSNGYKDMDSSLFYKIIDLELVHKKYHALTYCDSINIAYTVRICMCMRIILLDLSDISFTLFLFFKTDSLCMSSCEWQVSACDKNTSLCSRISEQKI
jgi:hypothetical protein